MTTLGSNSANQLKSFVERVERLSEEKKSIADDIRDVYAEAKATGYDPKAIREVIRLRRQNKEKLQTFEATVESYRHALGDLADTPLGAAAIERATEHATP